MAGLYELWRDPGKDNDDATRWLWTRRCCQRPYLTKARVQVSLRPLRDDIVVIDRLVAEVNAPSRSALIDVALDEYLS